VYPESRNTQFYARHFFLRTFLFSTSPEPSESRWLRRLTVSDLHYFVKMDSSPRPTASTHDGDITESGDSAVPSTPDSSLTFDPALNATPHAQPFSVRNICCVGAGYVGELLDPISHVQWLIPIRRSNRGCHCAPESAHSRYRRR
jgi:hypothetical protein